MVKILESNYHYENGVDYRLVESWSDVQKIDENYQTKLNESKLFKSNMLRPSFSYKKGELYITGVFLQADKINGNKRVYPRSVMDSALNRYMETRVKTKKALGEWTHPENRITIDHTKAVLLIEDMWWEGNDVMGRAIIATGDNAEGDKMASLMRIGWKPGVSSRGVGKLNGDFKKDGYLTVSDYRIEVGIDIVYDQSAPDAVVEAVKIEEGINESKIITDTSKASINKSRAIRKLIRGLNNI